MQTEVEIDCSLAYYLYFQNHGLPEPLSAVAVYATVWLSYRPLQLTDTQTQVRVRVQVWVSVYGP